MKKIMEGTTLYYMKDLGTDVVVTKNILSQKFD